VETGKCFVALFTWRDGNEWLAATPEGYFDGSWDGVAKFGLRLAGREKLLPVDKKMDYCRPDKIRKALTNPADTRPSLRISY